MNLGIFENRNFFINGLAHLKDEHRVDFIDAAYSPELELPADDYDLITVTTNPVIDAAALERFPRLKMVLTTSTGYNHIDVEACTARGVMACHIPSWSEIAVAEHCLALMLALARRLPESIQRTRTSNFKIKGLQGFELHGKTLGVIGAGIIGRRVLSLGRALGMKTLAYTAHPDEALAQKLGFEFKDLDQLLALSDVVSLHLPMNEQTRHFINAETIAKMKDGAILLNTCRGPVVETKALLDGLESGKLGGAGLDVIEELSIIGLADTGGGLKLGPTADALLARDDVIMTPHTAWFTGEARKRIFEQAVETIEAFLNGRPINVINKV